jgi:uncharacterized protein YbaP (TraB family)
VAKQMGLAHVRACTASPKPQCRSQVDDPADADAAEADKRSFLPMILCKSARLLTALLATALLLPTASAEARSTPVQTKRPVPVVAAETVQARPALWIAKDKDTTISLFGTIHLLKPNVVWFEGPIRKAFDEAQQVVVEATDAGDSNTQATVLQRALDAGGPTITSQLPQDLQATYAQTVKSIGLPMDLMDHVKPWFAAITLSSGPLQKLGYDPNSGADRAIMAAARQQGKELTGLETAESQIGLFADLPADLQISLLTQALKEQSSMGETIAKMMTAWAAGDPASLAAEMNESLEDDPKLEKLLLFDRNDQWAAWIKKRLKQPGVVFMAVGAGHLAGKGSVQDALAKRGVKTALVERR